jgi:hypothetical protein
LASDIPGLPLLSDGSEDQQTTSLESSDMSTNIDTKEIRMMLDMSDETLLRTIMDQRAERHAFKVGEKYVVFPSVVQGCSFSKHSSGSFLRLPITQFPSASKHSSVLFSL